MSIIFVFYGEIRDDDLTIDMIIKDFTLLYNLESEESSILSIFDECLLICLIGEEDFNRSIIIADIYFKNSKIYNENHMYYRKFLILYARQLAIQFNRDISETFFPNINIVNFLYSPMLKDSCCFYTNDTLLCIIQIYISKFPTEEVDSDEFLISLFDPSNPSNPSDLTLVV